MTEQNQTPTTDQQTPLDRELEEMNTRIVCALGGPASEEDKTAIRQFGELLKVLHKVRDLNAAVPFDTIAKSRVDLASYGAFGKPGCQQWEAMAPVAQRISTQQVYEVMVAALAAGLVIVPDDKAVPRGQDAAPNLEG